MFAEFTKMVEAADRHQLQKMAKIVGALLNRPKNKIKVDEAPPISNHPSHGIREVFGGAMLCDMVHNTGDDWTYAEWIRLGELCYTRDGEKKPGRRLAYSWRAFSAFRRWAIRSKSDEGFEFCPYFVRQSDRVFEYGSRSCGFVPPEMMKVLGAYSYGTATKTETIVMCMGEMWRVTDEAARQKLERRIKAL